MANNSILTRILLGLLVIAAIGSATYYIENKKKAQIEPATPYVFPDLFNTFSQVTRIRVTVPEGSFQIVKNNNNWVMPERENFPVAKSKIDNFTTELKNLRQLNLVTDDPRNMDILGVGEPKEFGFGTTIELFNAKDNILEARHISHNNGQIFVRNLGQTQIYEALGTFSKINLKGDWLDFSFLKLNPKSIYKIEIQDIERGEISLSRDANGAFIYPDGKTDKTISEYANNLLVLNPKDVTLKSRIDNPPMNIAKIYYTGGLILEVKRIKQFRADWLFINAFANNEESRMQAQNINQLAQNWAFLISSDDANIVDNNPRTSIISSINKSE